MPQTEFFDVLRLSRADKRRQGVDASGLTDAQMETVANDIGESEAVMEAFWEALRLVATGCFPLPRLDGFQECALCGEYDKCEDFDNPPVVKACKACREMYG